MKSYKFGIICLFLLLVSVGFVCAEDVNQTNTDALQVSDSNSQSDVISSNDLNSDILNENNNNYKQLHDDFNLSSNEFNFSKNYKYDDSQDQSFSNGLLYDFGGMNVTINGNGFSVDGNNKANIFRFVNGTVTINNLVFKNSLGSSIILTDCSLYTNNVTFEGSTNANSGGAIFAEKSNYYSKNDKFINNYANKGSDIFGLNSFILIRNSTFENSQIFEWSLIYGYNSVITIYSSEFNNLNSKYATVVYNNYMTNIFNSKFKNLHADLTAGAVAVKESTLLFIKDCEFINVSSSNNGGAIFADVHGNDLNPTGKVSIENTLFDNCSSEFGAALVQLGGSLEIFSSTFNNNYAAGSGIVYVSNATTANIRGNKFNGNKAFTGSALYLDNGVYTVNSNEFNNNLGYYDYEYGTIYIYDSLYTIVNASFVDSSNKDIHTFFDRKGSSISQTTANITKDDEIYPTYIQNNGTKIVLNRVKVNANATDSYFNLKDYNLVTPVKNQGSMGSCWAFGTTGAIESAFLMATNTTIILSENNMKDFNSRYSPYGVSLTEGGYIGDGLAYALSWLGVINSTLEAYDELGKISSLKFPLGAYHMLEAVYVNPNDTAAIKNALINYGALTIFMHGASKDSPYYNSTTFSFYCTNSSAGNHFVTIVGWDDTYSKENFNTVAPGDGAWICKNSWGTNWGYDGYFYLSYYDAPLRLLSAIGYVINNTEIYNNLYQYDLSAFNEYYNAPKGKSIAYANTYIAMGSEYISAVGTYFNDANVDYTVVIYINDNEVYFERGKSAFAGFNLIKLGKYVTINEGDNFTVEIQSNMVPLSANARQFLQNGASVMISNGVTKDLANEGNSACIKVYTMDHPSVTKNIVQHYNLTNFIYISDANGANCSIYYKGEVIANATVVDGKALFNVILAPGNYAILTDYNGTQFVNSIEILTTIGYYESIKLTENADITYTVKFLNPDGSVFAKGSKVSYVLDGKKYVGTIGDNGTLEIKLSKLAKGKHTIYLSNLASGQNETTIIQVVSRFSNVGNLNMYYFDGSTFKAYVYDDFARPAAGKTVTIYIKNKRYTAKTNVKGFISFKIPKEIVPGTYKIKISYAGVTVTKTLKVKQVLKTSKFKVKKSAKRLVLKAVLKQGKKALKGKTIIFKFNGKNYKAKTNKKGLAKVTVKKSAIKKLRAGKTYPLKVTYLKDTIKSTVKVRR